MNPANIGRLCLLAVFVFAAVDSILQGDTVYCTSVIDGDTIRLENGETVRLIGIDAPELSQPGGEMSRLYLAHLILGRKITLDKGYEDRDKYNRLLRFVCFDNVCVNEEMIRQ